jgi:hydroxypyruvate reductase
MPTEPPRDLLNRLFRQAIAAAHPSTCLPPHLPDAPRTGRLIVLAAGKAAGSMAEVAERSYSSFDRLTGVAVARQGYGRPLKKIPMIEAGHPIPNAAGVEAAERALKLAESADANDLVLVLLSGGASANWIAPVSGLSLGDKQALTRALLRSGANIGEINTVRKHLSRIKGGRLVRAAQPARVLTLAISDVAGDDPAVIGSGPTVPDPSTLADAWGIVTRYSLDVPEAIMHALADPGNESPKPGERMFAATEFKLIARPADAFRATEQTARAAGYEPVMLGDGIEGEARAVAAEHAAQALALKKTGRRAVMLSGGELTVTIRGRGRGGPNQEYALALAIALNGAPGIAALAGDTDGTDGGAGSPDDPAGAIIDETTLHRAHALGLDPAHILSDNDSTGFFTRLGDVVETGPTCTNVNDFRAIVVDRP